MTASGDARTKRRRERPGSTPTSRSTRRGTSSKHVLVTGYPGFISKRLLRRLFTRMPRATFTVLTEEARRAEAEADIKSLGEERARRVRLSTGDVTKMDVGLAGPEIAAIAGVTHVFHLAGVQRVDAPPALLESVNVDGTRNVLTLAREMPNLERFVHFSSCLVSGDREGVITEDELDVGQRFRTFYEETKARGEKLARAAMKDLPVTILRPSIVVGSSETGEIDRFDGVYQIAILVVTSPVTVPLPLPGTLSLLDGTGIACPRFDTYVDKLTGYVTDSIRRQRSTQPTPSADPLDG